MLATDPDREGEAIAWHLHEILKERGELKGKTSHRVVFHEITKNAIREAVNHPRELSLDLVNAQQARRALDYLVGFNLSPLLWKKVRRGLSAGRVQSPGAAHDLRARGPDRRLRAAGILDHRRRGRAQRADLSARSWWNLAAARSSSSVSPTKAARAPPKPTLRAACGTAGELKVLSIDRKQRRRNPSPPFTTSTLQQEASRKLGFSAQRTMRTAQQLYEGVDIGEGSVGLITYMRTDSVALAAEAVTEMRATIERLYGKEAVAEEVRVYKTKSKNAQEAHEAVRPTSAAIVPADIERYLDADQFKLYCTDLEARGRLPDGARGVRHRGRRHAGRERRAAAASAARQRLDPGQARLHRRLPGGPRRCGGRRQRPHAAGDAGGRHGARWSALHPEQHFTEPPPRYTEASLVKALEEYGIGRPSTYASIISTLRDREYVEIENRRFTATDIGRIVGRFLTEHFHRYVEYGFTAAMEDELDAVARGEEPWTTPLAKFWKPFIRQVEMIEKSVSREQVAQARELGTDPASGKPVTVRMGRFGPFVQIGTKDDAEKPRFAGLRPGQKMDTLQLADAFELFKLPRTLGETAEGETVITAIGRFGPYVKYGAKYVSLKEDDPYTVTLERALEVIQAKKIADANRIIQDFAAENIQVLNGRYGPYVTDKSKNARVPKDRDPKTPDAGRMPGAAGGRPRQGNPRSLRPQVRAEAPGAPADEKSAQAAASTAEAPAAKAKDREAKPKAKAKAKSSAAPKGPAAGKKAAKRG